MAIPKRVSSRIKDNLKRYQKILEVLKARDVSEADTVTVVKDILEDVFGFDKYTEITSEHAIRGTYCDLALQIDSKLSFLIEVKAIGISLKESHVKQAVDYASNQGCDWAVLTNGIQWILYNVVFSKPIEKREVVKFDLLELGSRSDEDLERLFLLTREGIKKSAIAEYRDRQEAMSRHVLAAIILKSDSVTNAIRREVRKVSGLRIEEDEIIKVLTDQVIKREALEGDEAVTAARRVSRALAKPKAKSQPKPRAETIEPKPEAAESAVL